MADPTTDILVLIPALAELPITARIDALNRIRRALHAVEKFGEPALPRS